MGNKLIIYEKELIEARVNLSRTKFILILACVIWPVGLFFNIIISILIFFVLLILWGVALYIATMHYLAAKNKIAGLLKNNKIQK